MVTDEERDYMYQQYATDPRMRRNVGISRRLFPLVEGDRRQAELLHSLLFTLPGTPILYYGDEIGMGDNINLGDRDGVRTPMQWTPDRNGGFSQADFASVYLPPSMDPVYGFGARNVESSQRNHASFLQWMRRMIQIRREHPIFGLGGLDLLQDSNNAVLAYLRTPDSSRQRPILCVANFSAAAQPVELDLGPVRRAATDRAAGRRGVPADRRAAVLADAPAVRVPDLRAQRGRPRQLGRRGDVIPGETDQSG